MNENIKNTGTQGAIQDIDKTIADMVAAIPSDGLAVNTYWCRPCISWKDAIYYSGVNIESSNVTNVTPLFLGENTFNNTTPLEQTYYTASFSQEVTTSKSTTTEHGFSSSTEVGGKTGIPFVASGEVKETLEYNFNHTDTQTTSITTTIASPPQPVTVPANKIYKAQVYFEKNTTSGNVELFADVLTCFGSYGVIYPIGKAIEMTDNTYGLIKSPNDSKQVRAKGKGKFKVEYGTNLIVNIYDVTAEKADTVEESKLVKTKVIPID